MLPIKFRQVGFLGAYDQLSYEVLRIRRNLRGAAAVVGQCYPDQSRLIMALDSPLMQATSSNPVPAEVDSPADKLTLRTQPESTAKIV